MITSQQMTTIPLIAKQKKLNFLDFLSPFMIGGISGAIATCLIQPIDTFKVQIQVTSEKLGKLSKNINLIQILREIKNQQGLKVLYTGLDSAILRQIFYGSARLGSYNWTIQYCKRQNIQLNKLQKVGIAVYSGAIGALIGNPFDVALIRKQASIKNSPQNTYKNTYHAFKTIITQQGLSALWTGIRITILRVVLINVGQLASKQIISDQIQNNLNVSKTIRDNLTATLASVLTSFISLPADNIKVKLQKQHKNNQIYKGIWDCLMKTVQREGLTRLWVGFFIYLVRGFPHSFVLIRVQQYLTQIYQKSKQNRN